MPPQASTPPPPLLELSRRLLEGVAALRSLAQGNNSREDITLLLRSKVVPELEATLELPVFLGVQGGTNTGKSTVFNALAGKLLSPSLVLASATKHPLVFAHGRWRTRFLSTDLFPAIECRELRDSRELIVDPDKTDLLYFRFHDDDSLLDLALIDSPDFDSALLTNAWGAARIGALSDLTLFITTAQKYRDNVLVEELKKLLDLKSEVIIIFNMVEEEIVFETIWDDLRQTLGAKAEHVRAVRLSPSAAKHPEDDVRETLLGSVLKGFSSLRAASIKPAIVAKALRRVVELTRKLVLIYSVEGAFKREIQELAGKGARECLETYDKHFDLSLPEETLVLRRFLRVTELGRFLELRPEVERASKILSLAGAALRQLCDTLRRLLLKLSASNEGTIEATPSALEEYARARDHADTEKALQLLEALRVNVESYARGREKTSAVAKELLRVHLTPELAIGFPQMAREAHRAALKATEGTGEELFPETEAWMEAHPLRVRALAFLGIALKIALGCLLAWKLPPAAGFFAFLHPLKWLYFALGYIAGAYILAWLAALLVRKRRKFKEARRTAMKKAVEAVFLDPLRKALDEILLEEDLKKIADLARDIGEHPQLKAMEEGPAK
jgi:hypothetical protein